MPDAMWKGQCRMIDDVAQKRMDEQRLNAMWKEQCRKVEFSPKRMDVLMNA